MELPIPSHLQEFLTPIGTENSEQEVTGTIHCSCGEEAFLVSENNERMYIMLKCEKCGREILLFDIDKHGYDGHICGFEILDRSQPLENFVCEKCGRNSFHVKVTIHSQGKEDFIRENVSSDNSLSADDWINAFDWITVVLQCADCGETFEEWLDAETM